MYTYNGSTLHNIIHFCGMNQLIVNCEVLLLSTNNETTEP